MTEATDRPLAQPEELRRFIKAVLTASDTAAIVQMVAYREGWSDLCVRIQSALAAETPICRELEIACRQTGVKPAHLCQRLEPVAMLLGGGTEAGASANDHFAIIGVSPEASMQEIRRAFRRQARRLHPDQGGDTQAFIELTRAYHTLTNPELRRRCRTDAQPTKVAWEPPPPPPSPAPARRSLFPLLLALALLIIAAFALDFAFRQSTPPHVLHANRTATDTDPQQASAGVAADTLQDAGRPSADAGEYVSHGPLQSAASAGPPMAPDAGPAESVSAAAQQPEELSMPVKTETVPSSADKVTAGPSILPLTRTLQAEKSDSPSDKPSASLLGKYHLVLFYAPDVSRQTANELAVFLQRQDYRLSAPTPKTFAGQSRVRFFHAADRAAAAKLRRAVQTFFSREKRGAHFPLGTSNLSQRHPGAPRRLLELWIGPPPAAETIIAAKTADSPGKTVKPSLEERMRAFVQAYGNAYASRDVVQVAALFDTDALENGRPIIKVLPIYQANMKGVKDIDYRIELDGFQKGVGNDAFHIAGRFFARLELPDSQIRESRGDIAMQLRPYGQSFLIKRLDYSLVPQ